MSRKDALKKLGVLALRVQEHLDAMAAEPEALALGHWAHEVNGWVRQMEEVLPHVGKKTGQQWAERIAEFKARLPQGPLI